MARVKDRERAIKLRLEGKSYSQIKEKLGVSKSTLSGWLRDHPLSSEQIRKLKGTNPRRIENYRNTMRQKREERLSKVLRQVKKDISQLKDRELFIAGLFLYWAEGTKTSPYMIEMTNTDPAMLIFFIKWLETLGVEKESMKIKLHLYQDMDIDKEIKYWTEQLRVNSSAFRKPYVKGNISGRINYKGRFGHGTCSVTVGGRDIHDYIMMGVRHISSYSV